MSIDYPVEVTYRAATGMQTDPRTGNRRISYADPLARTIWVSRPPRVGRAGVSEGEDVVDYTILTEWPVAANSTFTERGAERPRQWIASSESDPRPRKRAGRYRTRYYVTSARMVTGYHATPEPAIPTMEGN